MIKEVYVENYIVVKKMLILIKNLLLIKLQIIHDTVQILVNNKQDLYILY